MHKQHFRERLFSGNLFREWVAALPEQWQHLPLYLRLYAVLLIGGGLLFQLSYPITLLDSDMWYHLDGDAGSGSRDPFQITPFLLH